jgi:hypothetical protein
LSEFLRLYRARRAPEGGIDQCVVCDAGAMKGARTAITPSAADIAARWPGVVSGAALLAAQAVVHVSSPGALAAEGAAEKITVGRAEKVWIKEAGIVLDAKMDTGTLTSSLDAHDMHVFTKNDKVWVRFVLKNTYGKSIALERLVVRFARFKKQNHDVERRPVVELGLCLNNIFRNTQVNLSNRERFTYPMLIGRRFLSGHVVVDTEKKYTSTPHCDGVTK